MHFPAISPLNCLNFPVNSGRKPRLFTPVLVGKSGGERRTSRVRTPVSTLKDNARTYHKNQAPVNLSDGKEKGWVHFVGVGGCGMSALALLALKQGYEVSGSDIVWSSFMDGLQESGARLYIGHSALNIQNISLPKAIVMSSAIPNDNVEISHACSLGLPVFKRDQWLGKLTENYNLIAVSGTHGKSTTASLLAYVLKAMGDDVTAVVGAHVPQFDGGNIISGSSYNFVLEADEYDGCFLGLSPQIAVITNVEWEHTDIFQDEEAVKTLFRKFMNQIRVGGRLILCGDSVGAYSLLGDFINSSNPVVAELSSDNKYKIITYGISGFNEWHASSILPNPQGGINYTLCHRGCPVADISLQIPGIHNVYNSLAVIATVVAVFSGKNLKTIEAIVDLVRSHLNSFRGVCRRFEMIGAICGCHIVDDYAHHPTEVSVVIQAARQRFPDKHLLVVFQPHLYSRAAAFKDEFAASLSDADYVVVTEIYGSRERNKGNISGRNIAASITRVPAEYIPNLGDVVEKLVLQISKDPNRKIIILTLGAGDITIVGRKLLHELQQILEKK